MANNERPTYDAFKKDIAIVNFYFDKGTALQYKRKVRITMEDLISQFGGTLGGFLGVSLLGVAEIIYWFTVRLCLNLRKSRKLKQAEKAAGTASLTPATNGKSEPGMLLAYLFTLLTYLRLISPLLCARKKKTRGKNGHFYRNKVSQTLYC